MTWITIRAQDVWLFRDGKPFSGGEDHNASGMFPPTPLTVQGALRQKISVSIGVSLQDYKNASRGKSAPDNARQAVEFIGTHGTLKDMGVFGMQGPFICRHTERGILPLLPTPADLFSDEEKAQFYISSPGQRVNSDLGGNFQFLQLETGYENLPGHWMTADAFEGYLAGTHPQKADILGRGDIYGTESRFGVSTNAYTSFREDGQLYQVQFVRPQDGIGLLVRVNESIPSDLLKGRIQIGGEGRQAHVSVVENIKLPLHPDRTGGKFKVILLTPAYFSVGWKPAEDDWSAIFGRPVTLKSAALYRPLKIGGWSNASNTARPMHNYVAPGSVYYFETEEAITLPPALTQNPTDAMDAAQLGFGQYAIGQW